MIIIKTDPAANFISAFVGELTMKSNEEMVKWLLPVFIGFAIRSSVLLHPHSGQAKPPMYGDYEAQRHWMEVTTNLPVREWYFNTTDNDLNYWGLDYPPLSAYHSWAMGKISEHLNPAWTSLFTSRGMETYDHKVFMRYTVLLADLFIFVPSVLCFFHKCLPRILSQPSVSPFYSCCLVFLYPGLILVDHGHFQYNCVSLGLFVAAVGLILSDRDILGTIMFCLALGYKQMELYHALPLFFYLLGKCFRSSFTSGFFKLLYLSMTVSVTFIVMFLPFLSNMVVLRQVIRRIFPIARGLFEDKVSNFWCCTSPFIKWKTVFTHLEQVRLCAMVVAFTCLPTCLALVISPRKDKLLFSLAICSMNFFLFSYHVHEKSILLVAVPALCLLPLCPISSFHFSVASVLSMWPLFLKDGLGLACLCTTVIYTVIGHVVIIRKTPGMAKSSKLLYSDIALACQLGGFACLILAETFVTPPAAYPDIFALAISIFSFVQFSVFLLFWNVQCFSRKSKCM
ncbi:hypothetical protein T265_02855 [Opisthorchis viverrini]|uniref:Alpha-1,3-glucosyltransferase n=1 Tax=Opisthorchis viverrini TaxID=6198 RepID=A0A074ZUL8_OPIVI|nr:hypothetical protein T265_02855 [Opisthorchis viverrini]KER30816.1 hypothetical protein T265_02855 [Opisthorchis viverrini]